MTPYTPTKRQIFFQSLEVGIFIHFGIRTFYTNRKDWDGKTLNPKKFNPLKLDCYQWGETAKNAGAKYMILTAKHHDGFINWQSESTRFGVASSPWKEGRGDLVKEFTEACRYYKLKVGLYYSPADMNCPFFHDQDKYNQIFFQQIDELMSRYGTIDILWFDGCHSEGCKYDWKKIIAQIRKKQPEIIIFNMGIPDYRWAGNEAGLAPYPLWNTIRTNDKKLNFLAGQLKRKKMLYLPVECDLRIRDFSWFYNPYDENSLKTVDELIGIYYYSVGRGANMLLNIGPDRNGLFPQKDRQRLIEFGNVIKKLFSNPLLQLKDFEKRGDSWIYESKENKWIFFDHIVLEEDLTEGQKIKEFQISIRTYTNDSDIVIYKGYSVGHKLICQVPIVRAKQIRIEVLKKRSRTKLLKMQNVKVFCSKNIKPNPQK